MPDLNRRHFLRTGLVGLATGAGVLVLRSNAQPTPDSGELGSYGDYLQRNGESVEDAPTPNNAPWQPTEPNILGPFFRAGAPFRGKITPPLEPGDVLLIRGRVWGFGTRQPLTSAVLDIWQANAKGRYDNDDPRHPPEEDVFLNRARLRVDEQGYYEYETIHPGAYRIAPQQWRPPHIHYLVRCPGYKRVITQLYFKGDPHQATDPFIKDSLIIDLETVEAGDRAYRVGTFDIVLAPQD
ncbi:MAG: hypothetical protein WDZ31_13770 [Phycisphaeraceae bacterium]